MAGVEAEKGGVMVTGTRPGGVEEVGRRSGLGRGDHLLPRQEGRGRDEGTLQTF